MFTTPTAFFWLWILPALGGVLLIQSIRSRRTVEKVAGPNARDAIRASQLPGTGVLRWILAMCGLALLILALAGPAWDPVEETIQRQGRDVVFLVDVSKSMLADDLRPNRLERARYEIEECVSTFSGDRVALVAFAGDNAVLCPLTQDYGFFRMMLSELGVDSVARGGTNIGDAIRAVQRKVFDGQPRDGRDVILITDGEDHDSMPVEAAKGLGADSVRLIAIGIGNNQQGTLLRIPDKRGTPQIVKYKGEPVRTMLDAETLGKMAAATPGGIFLPVATNNFSLAQIYKQVVDSARKYDLKAQTVQKLQPKYQLFLFPAMILLLLAALVPEGKRIRLTGRTAALIVILGCASLSAGDFKDGVRAFQQGKFEEARSSFQRLVEDLESKEKEVPLPLRYNKAIADYRVGDYGTAIEGLRQTIETNGSGKKPNPELESKARLALANTLVLDADRKCDEAERSLSKEPLAIARKEAEEASKIYQDPAFSKNIKLLPPINRNLDSTKKLLERIEELEAKLTPPKQEQQNQQNQQERQEDSSGEDEESAQQSVRLSPVGEDNAGDEEEKVEPLPAELQESINGEKLRRIMRNKGIRNRSAVEKDW